VLKAQIVTDGRVRMTDAETIERLEEMQNYFSFMAGGKTSETIEKAIEAVKLQSEIRHIIDTAQDRIMQLYGSLIIEGYADIYEDIKREVEKCKHAG
jgi:phosphoribosylanthranilate isomerase